MNAADFGLTASIPGFAKGTYRVILLGENATSDFYGPYITNQIIREALHPYPDDLHIVIKVGALRDTEGGWPPALAPEQLRQAV